MVQPEWNIISGLIVIGIQLIVGIFYWQQQQTRFIIQVRKYWGVLLLVLLLTFFQPIIFSVQALYASAIVIAPMACFISFAYSTPKRLMVPNIFFWISVGIIVYNHWA